MRRGLMVVPLGLGVGALVEIAVFVVVGRQVGFGWAVLAVLGASAAGLVLLRREGIRAWRRFRVAARSGHPPGEQVTDGLIGLVAGFLLAVPGLVSGVVGVVLVLPPVRRLARLWMRRAAERRMSSATAGDLFGPRRVRVQAASGSAGGSRPVSEPVIEGEIVEGDRRRDA